MYSRENRRRLYEEFKAAFRHDRAKRAINPVTDFGLIEMTRERVRPSHMQLLSEPCPCCDGLGRIISRQNLATKIERWFARARAAKKYKEFHLVVHPDLASTLVENGINRVERLMKAYGFRINLVRDTTLSQKDYHVFDAATNKEITELYKA